MTTDDSTFRGFSLRRWSQRKLEAARAVAAPAPAAAAPAAPEAADLATTAPSAQHASAAPVADTPSLPPIDSLTIDSDFSAFLDPKVDRAVQLQALKKLFGDPRFNVMDGLDVYIDDYSIADPIAPELVRQLAHARYIFDPPVTRVSEAGIVEDVPPDEAAPDAGAAAPAALPDSEAPPPRPTPPSAAPDAVADSGAAAAQPRPEGSDPARR